MNSSDIFQTLVDNLSNEIAWRKQELENLKLHIESTFEENQGNTEEKEFLLRGSIALVYAHWEGGIKNLLIIYVEYVNRLSKENIINIDNINPKLLETMIFHKIENKLGYNNSQKRQRVINFCKNLFLNNRDYLKVDKEIVNTKSNLKFEVYEELVDKLGLNINLPLINSSIEIASNITGRLREHLEEEKYKNIFDLEKGFINLLVERRNYIAHGGKISELNKDFVIESIVKITNLLELNKDIIILNGQKLIEGIDNVL